MPQPADARILIVDDQLSNVRLLEHTLKRGGFTEVMSTTEPRAVVEMHRQHRYALIVLDLQMPDMNGLAVITALRQVDADGAVILVMSADHTQVPAALAAGATSFLAKPFKLPDVVERLLQMLKAASPE